MLRSRKSYIALQKSGGVLCCRAAQIQQSRRASKTDGFALSPPYDASLRQAFLGVSDPERSSLGPTKKAYNFARSLSTADGSALAAGRSPRGTKNTRRVRGV